MKGTSTVQMGNGNDVVFLGGGGNTVTGLTSGSTTTYGTGKSVIYASTDYNKWGLTGGTDNSGNANSNANYVLTATGTPNLQYQNPTTLTGYDSLGSLIIYSASSNTSPTSGGTVNFTVNS
jgi:hypothetical protein